MYLSNHDAWVINHHHWWWWWSSFFENSRHIALSLSLSPSLPSGKAERKRGKKQSLQVNHHISSRSRQDHTHYHYNICRITVLPGHELFAFVLFCLFCLFCRLNGAKEGKVLVRHLACIHCQPCINTNTVVPVCHCYSVARFSFSERGAKTGLVRRSH